MMNQEYQPNIKTRQESSNLPAYVISTDNNQYTIDLTNKHLPRKGSFPCPKCGIKISPDDKKEKNYVIADTKVKGDELSEVVLQCKKCGSTLTLTGFIYPENRKQ